MVPVAYSTPGVTLSTFSRSEEHTSELQSQSNLVCRLLLEKKNMRHPTDLNILRVRLLEAWWQFSPPMREKMSSELLSLRPTPLLQINALVRPHQRSASTRS